MEIWKDINGYEGLYQVSSNGKIKSSKNNKILALHKNTKGYKQITLHKNGDRKRKMVHRLVAEAFIPNPNNYPIINHKDECKDNCSVENLEWCTNKYNINYGTHNERVGASLKNGVTSKPIIQYDLNGKYIKEYPSMHEAARQLGVKQGGISMCCRGIAKTAYGFIWLFK
jgi:hypothetical protein